MHCRQCGAVVSENAKFCKSCGSAQEQPAAVSAAAGEGPLVGFSTRISDPAFARYVRNTTRWALLFGSILAVAAVVGLYRR